MQKIWHELQVDEQKLPERLGPGEKLNVTRRGHRKVLNKEGNNLRKLEVEYKVKCNRDRTKKRNAIVLGESREYAKFS